MNRIRYFFECCFNQSEGFEDLERIIQEFKNSETYELQLQLIREFHQIIETNNYAFATRFINKYGGRTFSVEKTEKLIGFLYDRLIGRSTDVKAEDFIRKFKGVFCPVCCPKPKVAIVFSLIEKAIVIDKDLQVYICKPCTLVWLTEDIRADNAQDYKKFMRTLGLKGVWKELKDIDYL